MAKLAELARRLFARPQARGPHGTGLAGADAAIDQLVLGPESTLVQGWLVSRDAPIDTVRVRLDGVVLGEAPVTPREDVAAHFAGVAHAARSGFRVIGAPRPPATPRHLELIGRSGRRDRIINGRYLRAGQTDLPPTPPPHLMVRVAGSDDPAQFRDYGLNIAAQLLQAVRAHGPRRTPFRLLDWGCGSGRGTGFMPLLWPGLHLTGCDIDAEAIDWCRGHLLAPRTTFHVTGAYPPLPFADSSFDAVVGSSVMTHLTADLQVRWLREVGRVLTPGGVFVTSVLGPFAAARTGAPIDPAHLRSVGIIDSLADAALDQFTPANYYRDTLQTIDYTYAVWGRELDILAYLEAGLTNHQDLVVMRKPAAGRPR